MHILNRAVQESTGDNRSIVPASDSLTLLAERIATLLRTARETYKFDYTTNQYNRVRYYNYRLLFIYY